MSDTKTKRDARDSGTVPALVRRLFCRHEWRFERGIYGDEINLASTSKIYRSWWKCHLCGKRQMRPGLGAPNARVSGAKRTEHAHVGKEIE